MNGPSAPCLAPSVCCMSDELPPEAFPLGLKQNNYTETHRGLVTELGPFHISYFQSSNSFQRKIITANVSQATCQALSQAL